MKIFESHSIDVIAQIVARIVEDTVQLGRQFGFEYPMKYAVGFTLIEPNRQPHPAEQITLITLRIDDTKTTFDCPWTLRADAGGEFFNTLQREASNLVHRWGDENPRFKPSRERARALADHVSSEAWQAEAHQRALAMARAATFRRAR
jgi:hypothetical protein